MTSRDLEKAFLTTIMMCLVGAIILALGFETANAQVAITGKITGVVEDASGAALPGATITLTSPALMAERTTQSGPDGSYLFDFLPLGAYEITIAAKGFKSYVQKDVVISSGFIATVSPHLQVGASGE